MSRSQYVEANELGGKLNLYRANVARTIKSKKGQAFLREMAAAMDAMPAKRLIEGELITKDGEVCAIGSVCKARGLDVSGIDPGDPASVAACVGISHILAAEIEFENDDDFYWDSKETPVSRWVRMRKWIDSKLVEPKVAGNA